MIHLQNMMPGTLGKMVEVYQIKPGM